MHGGHPYSATSNHNGGVTLWEFYPAALGNQLAANLTNGTTKNI